MTAATANKVNQHIGKLMVPIMAIYALGASQGGINAGIRTIWFNPGGAENPADIRPDFEIRSLNQIPALLERLR